MDTNIEISNINKTNKKNSVELYCKFRIYI